MNASIAKTPSYLMLAAKVMSCTQEDGLLGVIDKAN